MVFFTIAGLIIGFIYGMFGPEKASGHSAGSSVGGGGLELFFWTLIGGIIGFIIGIPFWFNNIHPFQLLFNSFSVMGEAEQTLYATGFIVVMFGVVIGCYVTRKLYKLR